MRNLSHGPEMDMWWRISVETSGFGLLRYKLLLDVLWFYLAGCFVFGFFM